MDWAAFEEEVVDGVRKLIRKARDQHSGELLDRPVVEPDSGVFSDWDYTWPDGTIEAFDACRYYLVDGSHGKARALIGSTTRPVRNELTDRKVVFGQVGRRGNRTHRPWTEFVRVRDGNYAATIPDPLRPRGLLKDGDLLPKRFETARVERADQLFESMINAPTLRVVVDEDDDVAMIRHGYWVATLRRRL